MNLFFQILYTKLFFVLGLLWIFEVLSGVLMQANITFKYGSFFYIFFKITDALNLLRGFFLLLIFVCKRSVWRKIEAEWKRRSEGSHQLRLRAINSQTSRLTESTALKSSSH